MDHVRNRQRFALSQQPSTWAMLSHGEPVLIEDVYAETVLAAEFRTVYGHLMGTALSYVRSWMAVPLTLQERVIGTLALGASTPGVYEQRHAALARAIANQAAVAIEHGRLYARAREAAALEQRQRLARELHDSISQALYGATMYAEAAATLLAGGEQGEQGGSRRLPGASAYHGAEGAAGAAPIDL
jgi:GAF domain-containing protein